MKFFPFDTTPPPPPRTLDADADTAPLAAYFQRQRAQGR